MIRIEKTDRILGAGEFTLSLAELSPQEVERVGRFRQVDFILGEYAEPDLQTFLPQALSGLLEDYKIYLVYVESQSQPISSIRSRKKMFYSWKGWLKEDDRKELEVNTPDGKSLLAGLISLQSAYLDHMEELLGPNLRFSYLVRRGQRSFATRMEAFLRKVVDARLASVKQTTLNLPRIISAFGHVDKAFIRLMGTGKDEEVIQFFLPKSDSPTPLDRTLAMLEKEYRALVEN